MIIEGWSFLDSLYMTIITISTVGFNEVHHMTSGGRIFSIVLIIGGVGSALYIFSSVISYLIEGHFRITFGRRRMRNRIAKLKEHFILCGYGRVGHEIARVFDEEGVPFVVIDNDDNTIARLEEDGYLYIHGDATDDTILTEAGIAKARGLVAAVGTDTDNTYITLTARGLYPDLFIEARASLPGSEVKLAMAGANRVISPQAIGGRRMALLALRPAVVDFIDTITYRRGQELQMENIEVGPGSPLIGMTIDQANHKTKATILAIITRNGQVLVNPLRDTIDAEDQLVVIGAKEKLTDLESTFEGGDD
jgi:voltage-gated potassium channel